MSGDWGWEPGASGPRESAPEPAGGQQALDAALQPPRSLDLSGVIWGIDPSTQRMALSEITPVAGNAPRIEWSTRPLPTLSGNMRRYGAWSREIESWLKDCELRGGGLRAVAVEQPFAHGRHVPPASFYAVGILLAALGLVVGAEVELHMLTPAEWKKLALGAGHGAAKKPEIMAWARSACGYEGSIQDEADAAGVATAMAVLWSQRP